MGIILLITGIIASVISFAPSRLLQYLFILTSAAVGVFGVLIGKNKKAGFIRSTYYSWIGFIMVGLSIALAIWATSLMAFVNVLGFFLLLLGMIEFVFAMQILHYEAPIPWQADAGSGTNRMKHSFVKPIRTSGFIARVG